MRCYVYKSRRRADTYLFLAQRDDFARLPEDLRGMLGEAVRANLADRGFHIQFPPPEVFGTHDPA